MWRVDMGYYSKVDIVVDKESFALLAGFEDIIYFNVVSCSDSDGEYMHIMHESIKLNCIEWETFVKLIESCKVFHWITIGEDGCVEENYNTYLISWEVVVTTPKTDLDYKPESNDLQKEVLKYIELTLPKLVIAENRILSRITGERIANVCVTFGKTYLHIERHHEMIDSLLVMLAKTYIIKRVYDFDPYKVYSIFI